MAKNYEQIIWSTQSEIDLNDILEYYLKFSLEKAYIHVNNIIDAVERTVFSKQWQIDEYDPTCRRIIVNGRYRVYYQVEDKTVRVIRIYPTLKDLDRIKK